MGSLVGRDDKCPRRSSVDLTRRDLLAVAALGLVAGAPGDRPAAAARRGS